MPKAWHLKSRPEGTPTADNFELREIELPPLGEGMIRVRNHWLSVDPYMRGRMNDAKSYVPPFQLGQPMDGGAVGEAVESKAEGFAPGDLVLHMGGWRDEAVVPVQAARKLPDLGAEPQQFLGVLGTTGATAYFGLLDAASAKEGDSGERLSRGTDREEPGRRRAEGNRRLFRQCRRHSPRCRARGRPQSCALRHLRDDRRL
jgi:NADPH-dependent curcumin reductase CurA